MFRKFFSSVRANILAGVFLTVPVILTVAVFLFLFGFLTNWTQGFFPELREVCNGYLLRILTLAAIVLALYMVGLLMRNFIGRRLYSIGDRVLASIPLIRNIYLAVRQISASLFTQRNTLFKEVVLVQYPRPGLYSLAFVTAAVPPRVAARIPSQAPGEPCVSLFIPTTPNPTSGVFILAPKSEVIPLNIPITDALTFIMSAGAVAPGETDALPSPSLLDRLEMWLKHNGEQSAESSNGASTTN